MAAVLDEARKCGFPSDCSEKGIRGRIYEVQIMENDVTDIEHSQIQEAARSSTTEAKCIHQ